MNNIKILAIHNDEKALKAISYICRFHDITIETSSLHALEVLKSKRFDVFIVTYHLPYLNGIDLLKEIRQEYSNEDYISIFCIDQETIHLFKNELCDCLFSYFIENPINMYDFKEIMKKSIQSLRRIRNSREEMIYV